MNEPAGWEMQEQCERERYLLNIEALNRCAAAGAHQDDLIWLAREIGIDPNFIKITNPKGT